MKDDSSRLVENKLTEIVNVTILKDILNAFTTATNLMGNIVDTKGKSIFSSKDVEKCCEFCKVIYRTESGVKRCQSAYERAGKQAVNFSGPYIFRCPAGLLELAAPIIIEGEHLGTIICGQVLMWEPEEFFWIELREMNKDLTVDFQELFRAVEQLPIVSGHQVYAAANLLYVVANYIAQAGWKSHEDAKKINVQQSMLFKKICDQKKSKKDFTWVNDGLEIDESKIILIYRSDYDEAKEAFQSIIMDEMIRSTADSAMFKNALTELVLKVSRIVMRTVTDKHTILSVNEACLKKLYSSESFDEMNLIVLETLLEYHNIIKQNSDDSVNNKIKAIIEYMENNYQKSLNVTDIAEAVLMSPSYVSRLFKKDTGITVMNFLAKTRLEKAKKFLRNPHYQIEEIAKNVGFYDASYFTKVFKKHEGMTPTQYRNSYKYKRG